MRHSSVEPTAFVAVIEIAVADMIVVETAFHSSASAGPAAFRSSVAGSPAAVAASADC